MKKGNQKLLAPVRYAKYMSSDKTRTLFKAFPVFQFSFCPLVGCSAQKNETTG